MERWFVVVDLELKGVSIMKIADSNGGNGITGTIKMIGENGGIGGASPGSGGGVPGTGGNNGSDGFHGRVIIEY